MTNEILALAQLVPAPSLEIPSWLAPAIFTIALGWLIKKGDENGKKLDTVCDDVRDLKHAVGTDGKNGLLSKSKQHAERLDAIEDRNIALDAIAKIEREQYNGPERRREGRRVRDQLMPELPPVDGRAE